MHISPTGRRKREARIARIKRLEAARAARGASGETRAAIPNLEYHDPMRWDGWGNQPQAHTTPPIPPFSGSRRFRERWEGDD